ATEEEPDGLAHRVDDQSYERDEREGRERGERLVGLDHEQRAERSDHDAGRGERAAGPRPDGEPGDEHEPEHDDSHRHGPALGPPWDGPDRPRCRRWTARRGRRRFIRPGLQAGVVPCAAPEESARGGTRGSPARWPREESNLRSQVRSLPLYPLSYGAGDASL